MSIIFSDKHFNQLIDNALKEHYRLTMERKNVPTDYLLVYTEGGEGNAVASAIEQEVIKALFLNTDINNLPKEAREFTGIREFLFETKLSQLKHTISPQQAIR
jgi:hypothetical protein